jgi:hypothetical protein
MKNADFLPTDLAECQQMLLAAWQQSVQLEKQAESAEQRVAEVQKQATTATQQAAELNRVLDATSDSYQELRQQHTATLEELAWYKRWVHGRRSERISEADGQQHLFDLAPANETEPRFQRNRPSRFQRPLVARAVADENWICRVYRTSAMTWICRMKRKHVRAAIVKRIGSAKISRRSSNSSHQS